ncbi:uncharacterized protein LOC126262884 [Schistocerca nitens]|uniref:uncharacterized protein LOC126262884 n=1 Tax=Schistocerca nitens TaxID=7011 RepID=UPI0021197A48|nr:uncharacterized protein LOC126262884 [Schistocerca nitens]
MNVGDVDMNGEADDNDTDSTDCITSTPLHHDRSKHCMASGGGARPKNRHLVNHLANGISSHVIDGAVAVNNNLPVDAVSEATSSKTEVNLGVTVNKVLNGLNSNQPENSLPLCVESYLGTANVNNSVSSCSRPLQNGTGKNSLRHRERSGVVSKRWNDDESSSDTGNEGEDVLSADECCFYTYKGDQLADLPSSFFRLDVVGNGEQCVGENSPRTSGNGEINENVHPHSGSSSPDMDFLEMDFDPGHSCDQNSDDDSDVCELREEESCHETATAERVFEVASESVEDEVGDTQEQCPCNHSELMPSSVNGAVALVPTPLMPEGNNVSESHNIISLPQKMPTNLQSLFLPRSRSSEVFPSTSTASVVCWPARDTRGHHCSGADLCSPGETDVCCSDCPVDHAGLWNESHSRLQCEQLPDTRKHSLHTSLYHSIMAKRLLLSIHPDVEESSSIKHNRKIAERVMIWSEKEACAKNVTQIGTSQCGATAVINVLLVFNIPYSLERVKDAVRTRLRAEAAPLPEYLLSRSFAGATHEDLIRGVQQASDGFVYARFIHMYPNRVSSLTKWLASWMRKGAVPILTLNLQKGVAPGSPLPDAWHHQMVFGVGPQGIYLTNPLECVSEEALWPQLSSPSVLLIRRSDILARWNEVTDLRTLLCQADRRWKDMNVLGQVVNIIRESATSRAQSQGRVLTSHITIPASYSSGITLVISRESPFYEELKNSPSSHFYA